MRITLQFVFLPFAILAFWTNNSIANLCTSDVLTERYNSEAELLETENFARDDSASNYKGDRNYNALIIACNRKRDQKKSKIETLPANHIFADTLPKKLVRGTYNYWGKVITGKSYAYQIERTNKIWQITVPIKFHWPKLKLTSYIDIPTELAGELQLTAPGQVCAMDGTVRKNGHVVRGYISEPSQISCRLNRTDRFVDPADGRTYVVTELIKRFWIKHIENKWSHKWFIVRALDVETIGTNALKRHKKENTIWHVKFNMNPNVTARYKAAVLFPHPMYVGINTNGLVHEFGHQLGLDDEYGSNAKNNCEERFATIAPQNNYIMCEGGLGIPRPELQKAVYDWIVTRRYETGVDF